ncbi:thyroglobulin-like, partial [Protobothrops mucrosquamatus]|uniref:thyroglobulin-like n=1 Tax=Protobothrops mucrosquamatus TaxID=103944 RepID=UPI0010FB46E0
MRALLFITCLCFTDRALTSIFVPNVEYEAESQPLRPCELQREKAFHDGEDYIPQCSEDGQFRKKQCDRKGLSCWCVDEKGIEVTGTKRSGSSLTCLSFCQLQKQQILVSRYINSSETAYIPRCLDSGDFDPVQCDLALVQCWCVDGEGMEIYGTRQKGKPRQCPGRCEIRDRRVLHGVGEKSPPQCSTDGEFLPVQCKFVNTTDRMVFDLIHHFNRFPKAFLTFSSFRSLFPEINGYCYCADSLGRELEDTGLEMLLENVYDTVFASLEPVPTFAESSMYRILQRRFLGVQLATTGRFRCPSKCEIEYFTATHFEEDYKPFCEEIGAYKPTQCQLNGECWCVDSRGQEIPGTRRRGQQPICGKEPNCVSERLVSLSRLFYGPVGHFSHNNLFSATPEPQKLVGSLRFCPFSFRDFFVGSTVLSSTSGKTSAVHLLTFETLLGEAVGGMFPSRELAQIALRFTSNPKRFQENLFGGMFLKNLVQFNFTGALGPNSKFNLDKYFQQVGMRSGFGEMAGQLLQGSSQEKFNLSQSLVDSFGRKVSLEDNQNAIQFLASLLEAPEFFSFLKHVISVPESVTKDLGNVVRILLKARDCTEEDKDVFVPDCTIDGNYKEIQCNRGECWCVDLRGKEIPRSRVRGTNPRCPTVCEKQRASLQLLIRDQPAGSEMFVPSCTKEGKFLPVQCHGKHCFCVNSDGIPVPAISTNSGDPIQCPSDCHLAAGQAFLRSAQQFLLNPTALTQLSNVYVPQCSLDGQWRPIQCNGPPEQAFEWYQRWNTQNNNNNVLAIPDLANILLDYKARSQQSFEDFIKILYTAGHQNVFPEFFRYSSFEAVPQDLLKGNTLQISENALLDPFTFWQLLQGRLNHYPGSYSDYSIPLGHFDLRNCWCVDDKGRLQERQASVNQVPTSLKFYRKSLFASLDSAGEALRLAFLPYIPQCDGQGNWEPIQCYESTGPSYCNLLKSKALVREIGRGYIPECERLQPFQSVQIQTQFQLILPPEKTCSPDYSGLLETFQIFILDELKSRGFCHIQVNILGNLVSVPVCGDSAVLVQCAAADRLGANITWQAMLKNVPATALPDLYDIEKAMVGENLLGRFEELIKTGGFILHLDNKQFQADTSLRSPGRGESGMSPKVSLGCKSGFHKVLITGEVIPNSQGCECEEDESCGFLTLSAMGSETLCELYSARESNYNCSTSGLVHGAWDNSLATSIAGLRCLIKVRSPDKKDSLNVYLKKGQEFTTAGVKRFEKTDFQDVVSGVYSISVVSASGTSLTDVHLFCRQACHQDACCDGFILSQLILDGASTKELFSIVESNQILTELNRRLPSQKYWLFKQRYSAEEALLLCLTRCVEDEFCLLADIPNKTDTAFFPCTLYPAAQVCNTSINNIPNNCKIVLPQNPQLLYQKTVSLEGSVKNFYTRLPFRKVSGVSVRNKMDMSGKTVSNGFFDCERLCDADPCCSGFGLLNASQDTDSKILCLTLGSLGIQTCSDELRSDWQISPCTSLETEARVHPFGWYQKS